MSKPALGPTHPPASCLVGKA